MSDRTHPTVSGADRSHAVINICLWNQSSLFSASTTWCLAGGAGQVSDTTNPTPTPHLHHAWMQEHKLFTKNLPLSWWLLYSLLNWPFKLITKSKTNGTQIKTMLLWIHFSINVFRLKNSRTWCVCVDGHHARWGYISVRFTRSARATNAQQIGWGSPSPTSLSSPPHPPLLLHLRSAVALLLHQHPWPMVQR